MKKLLLTSLLTFSASFAYSQTPDTLDTDNFNSYTVGNLAPNTSGSAPGQGDYYAYGGAVGDYQITDIDAAHGHSLQLAGGATAASGSSRFVFREGLDDAWGSRTDGNDFFVGSMEIYTGTATGSHRIGSIVYGTDGSGLLGITYNSSSKTINGLARLDDGSGNVGFYNITGLTDSTFPENTWIKVGYSYDYNSGTITYTINGEQETLAIEGYTTPANVDIGEMDFVNVYNSGNSAAMTGAVDNYSLYAAPNSTLGVKSVGTIDRSVGIYPNPTSDYLKFTGDAVSAQIFDLTGRLVSAGKVTGNSIDVRNLKSGSYMVKIQAKDGIHTEKFIKK